MNLDIDLSIGRVAERAGIASSAIRYYESEAGLRLEVLAPPKSTRRSRRGVVRSADDC